MSFSQSFLSVFPVPQFLSQSGGGLDISDHSVKFIEFERSKKGLRIGKFATQELPAGIVQNGVITNKESLVAVLSSFREAHELRYVRASLPEEPAYIFSSTVPLVSREEVRSLLQFKLEENVPIAPADAVIDFDVVNDTSHPAGQQIVAVSVVPESVAQAYTDLLHTAGFVPISLEIEAQAIARATVPHSSDITCMSVDIGRTRSCISVVSGGVVQFTVTVDIGGDMLTDALQKQNPNLSSLEITRIKNEYGLMYSDDTNLQLVFSDFAKKLRNEIERYCIYWQTHTDNKAVRSAIKRIYLSGGHANIAGLPEYLTQELFVPTERANVWVNAFSTDVYIPEIPQHDSLSYASAIGLALPRNIL